MTSTVRTELNVQVFPPSTVRSDVVAASGYTTRLEFGAGTLPASMSSGLRCNAPSARGTRSGSRPESDGGRPRRPQVRIGVWRLPPYLGPHLASAVSGPADTAGPSAYADSVFGDLRELKTYESP